MQEVAVKRQTVGCAFLRVELGSENVIPCNGARKALAVLGTARGVARL
jgi:hypothetical protein